MRRYSLWVVVTDMKPSEVRNALADYVGADEKLIVMTRVGVSARRVLPRDVGDWLKEHPA